MNTAELETIEAVANVKPDTALVTPGLRSAKIFPVELIVVLFAVWTFAWYRALEVPLRQPLRLFVHHLFNCIIAYGVGLILCALFVRMCDLREQMRSKVMIPLKMTAQRFSARYFTLESLFYDVRLLAAVSLMFTGYVNFMHLIPQINPNLYDDWFIEGERWLLNGEIGSQFFLRLFGHGAAPLLSECYTLFYSYTGALIIALIVNKNRLLAQRFFMAFVLLWFSCALTVASFPTYGPCYFLPDLFRALPLTEVSEMQLQAWRMKLFLAEYPKSDIGFYLICAFPSLHIAVPALGAIFLRPVSRFASTVSALFTAVTVVTTVYFGWHYFLDDVAGIAMAFVATAISVYFIPGAAETAIAED